MSWFIMCSIWLFTALCESYPQGPREDAAISSYNYVNGVPGFYKYSFETSDGIAHYSEGNLDVADPVVKGQYSYIGPDGRNYTVTYIADKNGYHPKIGSQAGPVELRPFVSTALLESLIGK